MNRKGKGKSARRTATVAQREAGRRNLAAFNRSRGGRPAATHGLHTLLSSGSLPAGHEYLAEKVDRIIAALEADLGGAREVTAGQRTILEAQRLCLAVLMLSDAYLRSEGLLDKRRRAHPLLGVVVSFVNAARLNALALLGPGLQRKQRQVDVLETVVAEYAARAGPKGEAEAQQ